MFADEYLHSEDPGRRWGRFFPVRSTLTSTDVGDDEIESIITDDGVRCTISGRGNGPIDAFIDAMSALGVDVRVLDYAEHALSAGGTRGPRHTSNVLWENASCGAWACTSRS
jgi:2-isopropylmalate synthase